MNDRSQDESKDRTPELLKLIPFMSEFPFKDYRITFVEKGIDFMSMGVSPILIKEFGDNGTIELLNFYYIEDDSSISISIYRDDVEWIAEESSKIKKMDSLRKTFDEALDGEDLIKKVKAIKAGKKFAKLINCDSPGGIEFGDALTDFLKVNETVLRPKIKLGLQKLREATLKSTEFSEKQFKAVSAFLNFQIHYSKILLGIVIAAKIY